MYCSECGKKNQDTSNFCEYCGVRIKHQEHAVHRPAGERIPDVTPAPSIPSANLSGGESPGFTAPGRSAVGAVTGRLLIFCFALMLVFPIIVMKRSVDFYKASGSTAPDSDVLSRVDELAAALGNRNVATRWGSFDRSVSRWATCTLALDLGVAICSVWIGFNLFTRKPLALVRARRFMLAVAVWAIVRDLLLPRAFGLDVEGNKFSMCLFLAAALAGYLYLKQSKQVRATYAD